MPKVETDHQYKHYLLRFDDIDSLKNILSEIVFTVEDFKTC